MAAIVARDQAIASLKSGYQQHLGIPSFQALTAQLSSRAQRARASAVPPPARRF